MKAVGYVARKGISKLHTKFSEENLNTSDHFGGDSLGMNVKIRLKWLSLKLVATLWTRLDFLRIESKVRTL
jgi:hypothetical protein